MNSIRDTFFEECEELLEALVEGLAQMEEAPGDMEIINAVFRSVHSIKGGAGAFGLDRLVNFAHTFETVMDKVRDRDLDVDEKLISLFHRSGDMLSDLVASARDQTELEDANEASLIKELEGYLGPAGAEEEFSFEAMSLDIDGPPPVEIDLPNEGTDGNRCFTIRFKPHKGLYENGHEPLLIFDALAELGDLTSEADLSAVPLFDDFDPAESVLSWTLQLSTAEPETTLHEVFEFVEGLCELEITVGGAQSETSMEPAPELQPISNRSGSFGARTKCQLC